MKQFLEVRAALSLVNQSSLSKNELHFRFLKPVVQINSAVCDKSSACRRDQALRPSVEQESSAVEDWLTFAKSVVI